ncbi:hypothetical protein [Deinococcus roseus]|uniref:Uncharacterized protein n=1 Tax=Deinococcus roseus TaxID=392414 RepID=A0ABQ2D8L6_9DEIO|nr:hypothetical protein [Deinococcus roseus]GGJ47721.1 hypothetical protein GCM10008938_37120 [Deinococcus roseus]
MNPLKIFTFDPLIETLKNTDAGPHTHLLTQAHQALEQQKQDLIHWQAQSFEIRSLLGHVLGPLFDLISSHKDHFQQICETGHGTEGEDLLTHLLQLKAHQQGVPVENLMEAEQDASTQGIQVEGGAG